MLIGMHSYSIKKQYELEKNKMKISVLISTYNGSEYLVEQLDSLRNQTRVIDEVVIIDDCSSDNTVDVAKEYINKYRLQTWRVIHNISNKGWKKNFIEGLKELSGEILFFCDQDDVWFEEKVEKIEEVFVHNPKINVVASEELLWDGEKIIPHEKVSFDAITVLAMNKKNYFIHCSGCTMAIRDTYAKKIISNIVDGWAHDDFFWKMSLLDSSLAYIEAPTVLHRIHANNESRKKRNLENTIAGCKLDVQIADALICYLLNISEDQKIIKMITHKRNAYVDRRVYLEEKKIVNAIWVWTRCSDIYRSFKEFVGDILLMYGYRS